MLAQTLINKHTTGRKSCLTSVSKFILWKAIAAIGNLLSSSCLLISVNDDSHLTHKQDLSGGRLQNHPPFAMICSSEARGSTLPPAP